MTTPKPPISFIGLGAMGFGMATHLLRQGYPVTGFDVYAPTLERFRKAGGLTAATPADTVRNSAYCICMVANMAQAQDVLLTGQHAAAPALPRGAALLLCSTVPASYVRDLQTQLRAAGRDDVLLVDAPVSGGMQRAADGTLSIMAGADENALAAARFLLEEMADADKLYMVRGGVGMGSNMKMVHQVLAAIQILAASEAMGLAARLGLDAAKTMDYVKKSHGTSFMFEHRTPRMLTGYQPIASAVTIILKDAGIVTSEARKAKFMAPLASTAEKGYLSALERGWGADDDSSLVRLYTAEGEGQNATTAKSEDEKLALVEKLLMGVHLVAAGECLSFAKWLDMDLDQVFDLCISAAGGSYMLQQYGPAMIRQLRGESSSSSSSSGGGDAGVGGDTLSAVAGGLQEVVDEARALKMPLVLGPAAMAILRPQSLEASWSLMKWGHYDVWVE